MAITGTRTHTGCVGFEGEFCASLERTRKSTGVVYDVVASADAWGAASTFSKAATATCGGRGVKVDTVAGRLLRRGRRVDRGDSNADPTKTSATPTRPTAGRRRRAPDRVRVKTRLALTWQLDDWVTEAGRAKARLRDYGRPAAAAAATGRRRLSAVRRTRAARSSSTARSSARSRGTKRPRRTSAPR